MVTFTNPLSKPMRNVTLNIESELLESKSPHPPTCTLRARINQLQNVCIIMYICYLGAGIIGGYKF